MGYPKNIGHDNIDRNKIRIFIYKSYAVLYNYIYILSAL